MPVYIMLANFRGIENPTKNGFSRNNTAVNDEIHDLGAESVASYSDFKNYDLVNVIESKEEINMTRIIYALVNKHLFRKLELKGPYEFSRFINNHSFGSEGTISGEVEWSLQDDQLTSLACCGEATDEFSATCQAGVGIT